MKNRQKYTEKLEFIFQKEHSVLRDDLGKPTELRKNYVLEIRAKA